MKAPSAAELLAIWERGASLLPAEHANMLIEAVFPEKSAPELAELTIGQRDSFLFALRDILFGQEIVCLSVCPGCNKNVEMAFTSTDLRAKAGSEQQKDNVLSLERSRYSVRFRLPNISDLMAISGCRDTNMARSMLSMRCLISASENGAEMALGQLHQDVMQELVDEMAREDPLADIQFMLVCPFCGRKWQVVFDIVSIFWSEIDTWAHRTLREVHTLALSYGWSESDILALSPSRRQIYLDMVGM